MASKRQRQETLYASFTKQQKPNVKRYKEIIKNDSMSEISTDVIIGRHHKRSAVDIEEQYDGNICDLFLSQDDVAQIERVEAAQTIVESETNYAVDRFPDSTPVVISDTETNSQSTTMPLHTTKGVRIIHTTLFEGIY